MTTVLVPNTTPITNANDFLEGGDTNFARAWVARQLAFEGLVRSLAREERSL